MDKIKNFTISVINSYNNSIENIDRSFNNIKEYIGFTLDYQKVLSSTRRLDNNEQL